jgi:antitoxin (DNA-binding transcriptional repressor) of toxin-antitoxin stability system
VIRLNVHEAKTHLSRYLARVEAGEIVVLCRHNRPIAEMRPIATNTSRRKRRFGIDEGKFEVPPEFFEPLPENLMRFFRGEAED